MIAVHGSRFIERSPDAADEVFRSPLAHWLSPVLDEQSRLSWRPSPGGPAGPHMQLRVGGVWDVQGAEAVRHLRTAPNAMLVRDTLEARLAPRLDAWISLRPAGDAGTEVVVSGVATGPGTHWLVSRIWDPRARSGLEGILDLLACRLALVETMGETCGPEATSFRLPLPAARPTTAPQAVSS